MGSRLFQEQKAAGPDLEREGIETDEAGDGGCSRIGSGLEGQSDTG